MLTRNMDATEVRKVWSTLQKQGKEAGYTRNELNGVFLKHLTEFVKTQVEQGHDEALALFDVKGIADDDNVILKDTGDMAIKFRSAYNEAYNLKKVLDREKEKERKEQQEQIAKDGTLLMNQVIRGETGVGQMQNFLDTNRATMNLRSVQVFEKFITDEQMGVYEHVDPQVDRTVYAKMTNGSVSDDYTEDQIQSMYLNQQISRQTYNQAMRRYQTESSEDFTKLVNSSTFRGIMSEMVNLKGFVGGPSDASEGIMGEDGSGPVTYYDMAEQALRSTLAQEIEEQGSITPERALELGRQVKEAYQTMAEDTEQNPLKSLADEYRRNGTSQSFYNRYKFYSGDPFLSKDEIHQELIDMGYMMDPTVLNATPGQAERGGPQQVTTQPKEDTTGQPEEDLSLFERGQKKREARPDPKSVAEGLKNLMKSLELYSGHAEERKEQMRENMMRTPIPTNNQQEE
jgi:hypothetical protein